MLAPTSRVPRRVDGLSQPRGASGCCQVRFLGDGECQATLSRELATPGRPGKAHIGGLMTCGLPREHIHATVDTCPRCLCGSSTQIDVLAEGAWLLLRCSDSDRVISRAMLMVE